MVANILVTTKNKKQNGDSSLCVAFADQPVFFFSPKDAAFLLAPSVTLMLQIQNTERNQIKYILYDKNKTDN